MCVADDARAGDRRDVSDAASVSRRRASRRRDRQTSSSGPRRRDLLDERSASQEPVGRPPVALPCKLLAVLDQRRSLPPCARAGPDERDDRVARDPSTMPFCTSITSERARSARLSVIVKVATCSRRDVTSSRNGDPRRRSAPITSRTPRSSSEMRAARRGPDPCRRQQPVARSGRIPTDQRHEVDPLPADTRAREPGREDRRAERTDAPGSGRARPERHSRSSLPTKLRRRSLRSPA